MKLVHLCFFLDVWWYKSFWLTFCGSLWGVFWVKVLGRANGGVLGFYFQLFFKGCWLLYRFLSWCSRVVCEQQNVGGGSCFCGSCDDFWRFWYNFCLCCFVDRGVSFVFGVSIYWFQRYPLLGGVFNRVFGFLFFDSRVYEFYYWGLPIYPLYVATLRLLT